MGLILAIISLFYEYQHDITQIMIRMCVFENNIVINAEFLVFYML